MNQLMQRIDTDLESFIIAVLTIFLIAALVWVVGLKLTIRANRKEHEQAEERRIADYVDKAYRDVDIPAFQREAKHPHDNNPWVK